MADPAPSQLRFVLRAAVRKTGLLPPDLIALMPVSEELQIGEYGSIVRTIHAVQIW
jgi:hypothetical protein